VVVVAFAGELAGVGVEAEAGAVWADSVEAAANRPRRRQAGGRR
jgi:hypothetical protein